MRRRGGMRLWWVRLSKKTSLTQTLVPSLEVSASYFMRERKDSKTASESPSAIRHTLRYRVEKYRIKSTAVFMLFSHFK